MTHVETYRRHYRTLLPHRHAALQFTPNLLHSATHQPKFHGPQIIVRRVSGEAPRLHDGILEGGRLFWGILSELPDKYTTASCGGPSYDMSKQRMRDVIAHVMFSVICAVTNHETTDWITLQSGIRVLTSLYMFLDG